MLLCIWFFPSTEIFPGSTGMKKCDYRFPSQMTICFVLYEKSDKLFELQFVKFISYFVSGRHNDIMTFICVSTECFLSFILCVCQLKGSKKCFTHAAEEMDDSDDFKLSVCDRIHAWSLHIYTMKSVDK